MSEAKSAITQVQHSDELEIYGDLPLDGLLTSIGAIGREGANYISDQLKSITERRAGRINASSIGEEEVDELLGERKTLLEKQYCGGLTDADKRRLALIRWSLDRIDDARSGEVLDALEGAIVRYEALREEIRTLMDQLTQVSPRRGRR